MAALPAETLKNELFRCCGSPGWVDNMMNRFPFCSNDSLLETATTVWWNLPSSEWLTAFTAHPQIGKCIRVMQIHLNVSLISYAC